MLKTLDNEGVHHIRTKELVTLYVLTQKHIFVLEYFGPESLYYLCLIKSELDIITKVTFKIKHNDFSYWR